MKYFFKKYQDIFLPLFLFLISFTIYFSTTGQTNPGYADSDEIITVSYLLSVAHPPGYPLQILITKFFTLLPISGSIAFKANLGSAFLHSFTLIILYFLCLEIFKIIYKKPKLTFFQKIISFLSSLTFGLTMFFWLYSTICEVFPLNNLLAMIIVLSSLKWYQSINNKNQNHKKYFFLTTILFGLGLSHVQTFCLLGPALLLFLISTLNKHKKLKSYLPIIIIGIFLSIIFFFLPYLLLFWLNSRKISTSWYFDQNLKGWFRMIFRQDYQGFNPLYNKEVKSYFEINNFISHFKDFTFYPKYLFNHFSVLPLSLALLGYIFISKTNKIISKFLLILYIFSGVILAFYMGIPDQSIFDYSLQVGILQRQYLLSYNFLAIFIFLGFNYIYIFFKKITPKFPKQFLLIFSFLIITSLFSTNYPIIKQKNNSLLSELSHQMLENVDRDSIIICFSDMHCMSLLYVQQIEKIRQDVHIIPQNYNIRKYYLDQNPSLRGFNYIDNPYYISDIISWNIFQNRSVYLTNSVRLYVEKFGVEGNPFFLIPQNHLLKIVKNIPLSLPNNETHTIANKLIKESISPKNSIGQGQKTYESNFYSISGYIYQQFGLNNIALQNYQIALNLNPYFKEPNEQMNNLILNFKNLNSKYKLGQTGMKTEELVKMAQGYEKIRQFNKALDYYSKATYSDPLDSAVRKQLADLYLKLGYNMQAIREYNNILKYHPQEKEIQKKLNNTPNTDLSRYFL